jgi:ACR3 family arsenite transporter
LPSWRRAEENRPRVIPRFGLRCNPNLLRLPYQDAAPSAMIGASNHFEVAIATSTMLFGLSSGAALATVVGVLIEVPLMLMLVRFCLKTQNRFAPQAASVEEAASRGPGEGQ